MMVGKNSQRQLKTRSRKQRVSRVLVVLILHFYFLIFICAASAQLVKSVDAVGMTVSDMDRSVEFFSKALSLKRFQTSKWRAASTSGFRESLGRG
jgi:hypothetical protein